MGGTKWTAEEDRYLRENYKRFNSYEHAENLYKNFGSRRAPRSIVKRAQILGIQKPQTVITKGIKWLPEEDQYLIDNCEHLTWREIQTELYQIFGNKRTYQSIRSRIYNLRADSSVDIPKARQRHYWTPEEEQYLIDNFANMPCETITNNLNELFASNVTIGAVRTHAKQLRKRNGLNSYPALKRLSNAEIGTISEWNSGHNKNGVMREKYIKTGPRKEDWIQLKRYLLGDDAEGKSVIFLNGDRNDYSLENLACVSNETHLRMMQNDFYTHDPELTRTGILVCELEEIMDQSQNRQEV